MMSIAAVVVREKASRCGGVVYLRRRHVRQRVDMPQGHFQHLGRAPLFRARFVELSMPGAALLPRPLAGAQCGGAQTKRPDHAARRIFGCLRCYCHCAHQPRRRRCECGRWATAVVSVEYACLWVRERVFHGPTWGVHWARPRPHSEQSGCAIVACAQGAHSLHALESCSRGTLLAHA